MKRKILFTIIIVIALALIALALTKPDRSAHYDAVRAAAIEILNSKISEANLPTEYASIGTMTATNIVDNYLQKNLILREHTFYTMGFVSYDEWFIPVSIGVFNHVFLTVDEKNIDKFMQTPELKQLMDMKSLLEQLDSKLHTGRS